MNNYERIKNMSIDEMAEFIAHAECNCCVYEDRDECNIETDYEEDCINGIKQWLQQESEV